MGILLSFLDRKIFAIIHSFIDAVVGSSRTSCSGAECCGCESEREVHCQRDPLGLWQFSGAGWLHSQDRRGDDSFTMTVKVSMECLCSKVLLSDKIVANQCCL